MELVSVIVPVYKVEKYLHKCVDSILSSTYTNLEVILVDDGSPDSCPQVCDSYAQADARVKVIHQDNRGLCAARNAGLDAASGKYVAFADSDDVVSPFLYEKMVETIEAEGADLAACEYTRKQKDLPVDALPDSGKVHVLQGREALLSVLTCAPSIRNITWTSAYIWNKLYLRESIVKPFREGCLHSEDLQFNWDYIQNNSKLAVISSALYFYRVNEESITETYRNAAAANLAERSFSIVQVNERIAEQIPAEYTELKRYMIARTVNAMVLCSECVPTASQDNIRTSAHILENTSGSTGKRFGRKKKPTASGRSFQSPCLHLRTPCGCCQQSSLGFDNQ